jgi:hypothetical protein
VVLSFALSSILDTIYTRQVVSDLPSTSLFPRNFLSSAALRLAEGLTEIFCFDQYIDDTFVLALSQSGAAKTLKSFTAPASCITRSSASAWSSFAVLETLHIATPDLTCDETLQALSRLPQIRLLTISSENSFDPELLRIIWAPDAFPNLSVLNIPIREHGKELDILLEMLEMRPQLHLIEEITLDYNWKIDDRIKRLHQLCPSLVFIHGVAPSLNETDEFWSTVSNLDTLTMECHLVDPSLDFLSNSLPRLLPSLKYLNYRHRESLSDFSVFSCLKSLEIVTDNQANILKWPPLLKHLSIFLYDRLSPLPRDLTSAQIDLFFANLAKSLPNLESITIESSPGFMSKRHVELLLLSFTKLELASFNMGYNQFNVPLIPFVVSHPSLRGLPELRNIDNLVAVAGNLPCRKKLIATTPDEFEALKLVSSNNMPDLCSLRCISTPWKAETFTDILPIKSALQSLADKSVRIKGLSFSEVDVSYLLGPISALGSLRILELGHSPISCPEAASLLVALPWLHNFSGQIYISNDCDLNWINHPRLTSLSLKIHDERTLPTPLSLALTASTMGSLYIIDMKLKMNSTLAVRFQDLEYMRLMNISELTEQTGHQIDLSMSGCKQLYSISLFKLNINSLNLQDVMYLNMIRLDYVIAGDDLARSTMPEILPLFNYFQIEVNEAQELEKFREFISRLRKATVRQEIDWTEKIR